MTNNARQIKALENKTLRRQGKWYRGRLNPTSHKKGRGPCRPTSTITRWVLSPHRPKMLGIRHIEMLRTYRRRDGTADGSGRPRAPDCLHRRPRSRGVPAAQELCRARHRGSASRRSLDDLELMSVQVHRRQHLAATGSAGGLRPVSLANATSVPERSGALGVRG